MKGTIFVSVLLVAFVSTASHATNRKGVMKYTTPACYSKDDASSALEMLSQKDFQALAQLLLAGRCITLNKGDTVYLTDTAILSGLVQVRKQGDPDPVWVATEFAQF